MLLDSFAQQISELSGKDLELFSSPRRLMLVKGEKLEDSRAGISQFSPQSSSCVMVYDYFEHDILGLILRRIKFNAAQKKCILK